jgi:cytochrome P450
VICPRSVTGPAWKDESRDGALRLHVAEPYFDTQMDAWVVSRYADVMAAFYSTDLVPVGPASKAESPAIDEAARLRMRVETKDALLPTMLRAWRRQMLSDARGRVARFDCDRSVDLIRDYAQPLCLALAILVTQPDPVSREHLVTLAADVSVAAAEPLEEQLKSRSKAATLELRSFFNRGPELLRDSGFVALSHTLVSLLGNAWFALASHPQEWKRLHERPALLTRGVEEVLRFAGLTRLLYRRAIADTTLNGFTVRRGQRVIVCLLAANRDPDRYANPDELLVARSRIGHVSLGAGLHACVGAPLIRAAVLAATLPLVERFSIIELAQPIEWRGGTGFVSPSTLPVVLRSAAVLSV